MSKELEPCPLCGNAVCEMFGMNEYWFSCTCGYSSGTSSSRSRAVASHNTRAIPPGYVTEEECRRRCFDAWQAATAPLAGRKLDFLSWYAENYEEKDD